MSIRYPLYWLVRAATYLIAACMGLLVLLLVLLNTELGSRFTLHQAQHWLNNWVSYESFEGTLLRDFTLHEVEIRAGNGTQVHIQSARLRWWPWQLLQRQAHIRLLDIAGVNVQLASTAPPAEQGQASLDLPNIQLDLNIRVDQLIVESAEIHTPDTAWIIDRLQTRGRFENNELRIHDFQLNMPEGRAQLRAELTPQNEYTIAIEGGIAGEIPDIGMVTSDLDIRGALKQSLTGRIELNDGVGALIEGQLNQPLSISPRWQLQTSLYHVNHPEVANYVSEFTLQFEGSGSFSEARGHLIATATAHDYGFISVRSTAHYSASELTIEQLYLQASEFALATDLAGTVQFPPGKLNMQLVTTSQWADYPEFTAQLDYQGSMQHVDRLSLAASSTRGNLKLEGSGQWMDVPNWDIRLSTHNVDVNLLPLPHSIRAYLAESKLTSSIVSQGQWSPTKPQVNLEVKQFEASFDKQPLSIQAKASISQQELDISLFELQLGEGKLSATAQGTLDQFDIKMSAEQLTFLESEIDSFATQLTINTTLAQLPIGHIQVSGLRLNSTSPNLSAHISLTHDSLYQLQANLISDEATARMAVQGDWQKDQWQGQLTEFAITNEALGNWTLPNPTVIAYSPTRALIEPFCLRVESRPTHICAELNWQEANESLMAEIDIKEVELALLEPFLPNLLTVEGAVNAQVRFQQQGEERNYTGQAFLQNVGFSLPAQDISLTFADGELFQFEGDEQQLEGRLGLTTDAVAGGLQAKFTLEQPFADAQVHANATLDFNTLTIVSLLVPDIQNVKGKLDGSFNLSGPLERPNIGGTVTLSQGAAEVPAAGLVLSDFNVLIESPRNIDAPFLMSATARSGEGILLMTGHYDLTSHIADFDISGESFTAMNSREINLVVSPNAQVKVGPELLQVRGNLNVEHALITPPDFDSVEVTSADTIIVRGEQTLWQNSTSSSADVDIQVALGSDFKVVAYGFEGQLTGQLRVIEKPNQETTAVGNIQVAQGEYELYGQSLTVERGNLVYTGGVVSNPGLDLRVSRTFPIDNVTVGARVGGALQDPRFNLYSTPTMQDAEILSYLAFGRGFGDEKSEDENMLLKASLALGMQGGNLLGERLSASLGVDEIMLDAGDTIESTSLYIGKHLSPRLYIQYGIGLVEPVNTFFIRYRLTDYLNFETQTGTLGSGADLFYSIER